MEPGHYWSCRLLGVAYDAVCRHARSRSLFAKRRNGISTPSERRLRGHRSLDDQRGLAQIPSSLCGMSFCLTGMAHIASISRLHGSVL